MNVHDLLVVEEVGCGEDLVLQLVVLVGCEGWLHLGVVLGLAYQVRWRVRVLADEVDAAEGEPASSCCCICSKVTNWPGLLACPIMCCCL